MLMEILVTFCTFIQYFVHLCANIDKRQIAVGVKGLNPDRVL